MRPPFPSILIVFCMIFVPFTARASVRDPNEAFREQEYELAEKLYQQRLQRRPLDSRLHYNLGVSKYQQHSFEEAKSLFNQAAASDDLSLRSQALFNRGMAEFMLGSYADTLDSWQQALSYNLDDERIAENLRWLLDHIKETEADQDAHDKPELEDQQGEENLADQSEMDMDGREDADSLDQESLADIDQQDSEPMTDQQALPKTGDELDEAQENDDGDDAWAAQEDGDDESQGDEPLSEQQMAESEAILSPEQMEMQDAEQLIRSIEDQLGRVPIPVDPETLRQRRGENAW